MSAELGSAFDYAPVPMAVVTSTTHTIVRANTALTELLGVPRALIVGRRLSQFRDNLAPVRLDIVPDPQSGDAGPTYSGERACVRKDGSTVWFEVHSAVLPAGDTLPESPDDERLCLLHLIDISRRKAAEAERDRQQAWVGALGEVRLAVLLGVSPARALALVCARARVLLDASDAVIVVPLRDGLTGCVEAADGDDAWRLVGRMVPLEGSLAGEVLHDRRVVLRGGAGESITLLDGLLPAHGRGSVLAIPLRTPEVVMGALCLVRRAGQPFTKPDVDVARSFADQAAAALHIGELRLDRERLRVMEDRERIARDLHDSVIQDLFAAGMSLEGVRPLITSPRAAERVAATVDQLDRTIKQVRSTIFELESSDTVGSSDELVRRVVENRGEQLGFEPKLEIDGQLAAVPATSMEHVLAVLSEGLSNVARHSGASAATVRLRISRQGGVDLQIDDDGTGFDPERVPRGNGLANMHRRAQQVRGSLEVLSNTCGTVIHLRIPSTDDRGPLGRLIDLDAMEATDAVGPVEAMDVDHRSPAWAGVRA